MILFFFWSHKNSDFANKSQRFFSTKKYRFSFFLFRPDPLSKILQDRQTESSPSPSGRHHPVKAHLTAGAIKFEAQPRIAILQIERFFPPLPVLCGTLFARAFSPLPFDAEAGKHQRPLLHRQALVGRLYVFHAVSVIERPRQSIGHIAQVAQRRGRISDRRLSPATGSTVCHLTHLHETVYRLASQIGLQRRRDKITLFPHRYDNRTRLNRGVAQT